MLNFKKIDMMKKIIKTKFLCMAMVFLTIGACSDEFLDRPPEDTYNVAEFYQTIEQVQLAPNALYNRPWYDYISNVSWTIGEIASGNARTWDPRNQDFMTFAITGEHNTLGQAWTSMYSVIAQANAVINTIPNAAGPDVPDSVVNSALGEARAMRATAYFYLVRIFGSVPILEDNTEFVDKAYIPRNTVEDIYEFIKRDYQFAVDNIVATKATDPGRISSNGAKAMLAKVNLTAATMIDDPQGYTNAYNLSREVIESNEFKLLGGLQSDGAPGSYYDVFSAANDNNEESIFALQWTTSGAYAEGNAVQSLYGPSGVTGFSDGWSALGPALDLQDAYEDTDQDERFYATIMARESFYPDINGGYTAAADIDFQGTGVGIKKYVIGNPANFGGGAQQSYPNNTYILRYGELLLIYAEAIINGGGGSLADAENAINNVRTRAGLDPITNPTQETVFQERRIELAFEMEFWFDVIRMENQQDALDFLSSRERGTYDFSTDPPTVNTESYPVTADKLLFPYPSGETLNNPALLDDPVPYY